MLVTQLSDTSSLLPLSADDRTRLIRLCAYLSGDREAAEDLAQETLPEGRRFWKAHPRIRTLRQRAIDAGGVPGLRIRMESIDSRTGLDAIFARADDRLLGVHGGGNV